MSRIQKITFVAFIILSGILAYSGYRYLRNAKQPSVKAFTLLTDNCTALITFENYPEFSNSLRNQNLLWQDARNIHRLKPVDKYLVYFDSLIAVNNDLKELVADNPVFFAAYPGNKFLLTLNLKELSDEKTFSEKTARILKNSTLSAELHDGVLGVANDNVVLKSMFNVSEAKLVNNKIFSALKSKTNYQGTCIYVNDKGVLNQTYSAVTIKPESIALNGVTLPDSSLFEGDWSSSPLNNLDFLEHIPLLANAFDVYSISSAEKLSSQRADHDWWKSVNEMALFNAKKQFYDNISLYIIKISLPSKNKALLLHIADSTKISEIIPFMKDSTDRGTAFFLLNQNGSPFSKSTFSKLNLPEFKYIAMLDGHVVLTESAADAEIFVNAFRNKSSILQNADFRNYATKNLDIDFQSLNYAMPGTLNKQEIPFGKWLIKEDLNHLKNIAHYSLVKLYKNGMVNHRFNVKYFQENILDEPNVLWTMKADSIITTRPFMFKNHVTGGNEIVFQTQNNDLYLVNATGKLEWKKHLAERIRSDVFTVDAFKNGKLQLLFNTDNFIHLLDRNGNYVQGYPVKLPARATNKLSVFDYENKNDLRLFIACSNNKIYNYTIWGVKNDGYKPLATSENVMLPIKYCKVGLSDYLITADKKGKIYVFSRKGDGRIDFKNKLVENVSDFEVEEGSSLTNTQLIYYDEKNNLINKISLADKKEVASTNGNGDKSVYAYLDFDKNKILDVVLAESAKVEVFDLAGNKIFTREEAELKSPFRLSTTTLANTPYITVYDSSSAKAWLFSEPTPKKDFNATELPLPCNLFNDGKPYVLVVSGRELKCYKL